MKKIIFFLILLISTVIKAQNSNLSSIVESETKSALRSLVGIENRNANTGNYDAKYHRIELNIDPSIAPITGSVTTYFEAKENLSQVIFELTSNMTVTGISQRNNALSFTQNTNDEITITLPNIQNTGVLDSLTISYSGNPTLSGDDAYTKSSHNGNPVIYTLSEPYGAKGWWPCKQDLNDKIDSLDVFITTPQFNANNEENVAVSNGLEISQVIKNTYKTTHFKHKYPIPAYLFGVAITNYEVYSHTVPNNGNPFDIVNYVYPETLTTAQTQTGVTVAIINLFSNLFEEYPFADEKYGHAQWNWNGGMEHTTISFMSNFSRDLISHELAHQWFGDKVTCGSWKDIWLNEGFATYLTGLTKQNLDGEPTFKTWRQNKVNYITSATNGYVYLHDADTTSIGRIFNQRLSYDKGAMVLHMLRKKLGDTNFFQGVKNYLSDAQLAYNYAKTTDFKLHLETVSNQNLTEFFNDWIYNEGYPSYTLNWSQTTNSTQVSITVNQTQSDASVSYFEAPIPIKILGTNGEILDTVLNNTTNGESFNIAVTFTVSDILFDPDTHLISKNNTVNSLSNNKYNLESKLIIYPNPSSENISIRKLDTVFTIQKINIFDVLGKQLLETEQTNQINIQHLSFGTYFVKIKTNKGTVYKKFIKK